MNLYQDFIFHSKYSKNNETWENCVDRYIEFMKFLPYHKDIIKQAIVNMDVMPSMRALKMSGEAIKRDNSCMYNCAYKELSSIKSFCDIMYLLFRGVGCGSSVEYNVINKLPNLPNLIVKFSGNPIVIGDTTESICDNIEKLLIFLYQGIEPIFDYSLLRPKGSPLMTTGGFAVGFEAIKSTFDFIISVFKDSINHKQKKLNSINCYDIITNMASIIQCGGVRRSALLVLIDLADPLFNNFKSPDKPHRYYANVSEVYNNPFDRYDIERMCNNALNPSGEPGFFSRYNAKKRFDGCRGLNPCGEILLEDASFCNLTEVICRPNDTLETLLHKAFVASIIATYQSSYTFFPYVSRGWNKEKSISLGVSLTGIYDCPIIYECSNVVKYMKAIIRNTNIDVSQILSIKSADRYTCIKPSGTVSQLVNSSSGIHPRFARYYKRAVICDEYDTNANNLIKLGLKSEKQHNGNGNVLYFPIKCDNFKPFDFEHFLQLYTHLFYNYTDNNISCTITINKDSNDINKISKFLALNRNSLIGITFLLNDTTFYPQMPYQEITKKEYDLMAKDYKKLSKTVLSSSNIRVQEYSCTSGKCEA
jgi:ribonucleoside-diphosphate reductase alpha chain